MTKARFVTIRPGLLTSPALWLLVGFFGLYFLTSAFDFFISDGEVMFQTSREIALRGRFDQAPNPGLPQITQGHDGLFYSKYGLGQPLIAAGFYKFGMWLWFNFMPEKWDESIAHFAVTLLPLIVTALTVWLVYLFGKRLFGSPKTAIGLALLYGLGTSAWPYSHFFFSEPLFTFCLLLAAYALFRIKGALTPIRLYLWILLAGFALGYALLTRISGLVLVPAYLIYLWQITVGKKPDKPLYRDNPYFRFAGYLMALGLGLLPSLAVLAFYNWIRSGNILNNGYEGEGFTTPIWEGFWGLLFSTGKSVFIYSPVLIAVPYAVKAFLRHFRPEAIFFGLIISITLLYYSAWWAWYGGFCWGPRFLVPILPFAVLILGTLINKSRIWILILFVGLLPISIFIQMLGIGINFNIHLANITQFQPGWDANYIFVPTFSPLRGHFELFWNPDNNVIRSLSLEQIGLNSRMAKFFSAIGVVCLLSGIFMLCYSYISVGKKVFAKPIYNESPDTTTEVLS